MLETIRNIIQEYLNDETIKVEPESVFSADLGIDSYEFVDIICALEGKYNLDIEERVFKKFRTVQDIINYLEENVD